MTTGGTYSDHWPVKNESIVECHVDLLVSLILLHTFSAGVVAVL